MFVATSRKNATGSDKELSDCLWETCCSAPYLLHGVQHLAPLVPHLLLPFLLQEDRQKDSGQARLRDVFTWTDVRTHLVVGAGRYHGVDHLPRVVDAGHRQLPQRSCKLNCRGTRRTSGDTEDRRHGGSLLLLTWPVGVLHLGHLRSDELGGVLLPAAVSLLLLALLHLLIVVLQGDRETLQMDTKRHLSVHRSTT